MSRSFTCAVLLCLAALVACGPRGRRYELQGQVLAIDPARQTLTIKHGEIKGFMPGMTMPYRVNDPTLIEGRTPGDLVRATLVVEDTDAYLVSIEKTGWAPPPENAAPAMPAAAVLEPGQPVPDQQFVDQDGRMFALSAWRGRVVALTFIYTRCPYPTYCPLMDRQFKAVQTRILGDPALRARVRLLSLSFDPDYDTPAVLAAHAERLGAEGSIWTFATAERPAIDRFGANFGLMVARDPKDPLAITHSLSTAVIDPGGRLVALHRGNDWTVDALLREIQHAATER